MLKRSLISGMWFVALWSLGSALHVYLEVPRPLLLAATLVFAIAVWVGLERYDQWHTSPRSPRVRNNYASVESTVGGARLET